MGPAPQSTLPPGWYPDPWYPQSVRYWDGWSWTAYAQSTVQSARIDLTKVRGWAQRAPIAFWAQAACGAISAVATPFVFGQAMEDAFDGQEPSTFGAGFSVGPFGGGGNVALQLLSWASFGAVIMLMVWGHHITQTARSLGLRTTLSPGWAAAGWLVPIVNFWFPFQVVRDALPLGHPARAKVGVWWGLHIATAVIGIVAVISALASAGAGAAVGAIGAACALGSGYFGHELATAIGDAHERMAQPGTGTGTAVGAPL